MKKLYTRDEFQLHLSNSAKNMALDTKLQEDAIDILVRADKHN